MEVKYSIKVQGLWGNLHFHRPDLAHHDQVDRLKKVQDIQDNLHLPQHDLVHTLCHQH
jgi:hypothetical protein